MINESIYHGSERNRGEEIVRKKQMVLSRGEKHWLGDGAYFYTEEFYSYKWIVDMYNKRYAKEEFSHESLMKWYLILKGKVHVDAAKVFDLTKAEHKIIFDFILKELKNKLKISDGVMPEGVVINYMFEELGYKEKFDLVKALFGLNRHKYKFKNRLGYMPQEQICIKNTEVVQDIEEHDFKESVEYFHFLIYNMYYDNINENPVTYKYSTQRKPLIGKRV